MYLALRTSSAFTIPGCQLFSTAGIPSLPLSPVCLPLLLVPRVPQDVSWCFQDEQCFLPPEEQVIRKSVLGLFMCSKGIQKERNLWASKWPLKNLTLRIVKTALSGCCAHEDLSHAETRVSAAVELVMISLLFQAIDPTHMGSSLISLQPSFPFLCLQIRPCATGMPFPGRHLFYISYPKRATGETWGGKF